MVNIRKLEADLWESADLLRVGSKLTSNQYCMPVLGLIFLRKSSLFLLREALSTRYSMAFNTSKLLIIAGFLCVGKQSLIFSYCSFFSSIDLFYHILLLM